MPTLHLRSGSSIEFGARQPDDEYQSADHIYEQQFDWSSRAHYNDGPTSADKFKALLNGLPTLDIDAGPSFTKIWAHGSGGVRVKELTMELEFAARRLNGAGYDATIRGGRTGPIFIQVRSK